MKDNTAWRILIADDETEISEGAKEYLEAVLQIDCRDVRVDTASTFEETISLLEERHYDLVVLDVRMGVTDDAADPEEEAGPRILEAIKDARFIPVVFWTGLPEKVRYLSSRLVGVVEKTKGLPVLCETICELFQTGLPSVNRALREHVEQVQRDYMWNFVASHWEQFGNTPDTSGFAYLLARRLAMSLSGQSVAKLTAGLGGAMHPAITQGCVHPMQYYIIPPLGDTPVTGDIYVDADAVYWIVLTPSCDIAHDKAEHILLSKCARLAEQPEFINYQNSNGKAPKQKATLQALIKNNRNPGQAERYHFLPSAFDIPDMVVDFQSTKTLTLAELSGLRRAASLDSPFAEALIARFTRYMSRIGTPDLEIDLVFDRLC